MNLKDSWNFTSKLTTRKLINAFNIYRSYQHSTKTRQANIRGLPISLSIEPTTSCNLRCPECPSGLRSFTRPTGMLAENTYEKILDELAPSLIYLILYFQGEPYLNPNFFSMISEASSRNIYTATSTNGHYLGDEMAKKTVTSGLDRLIVSIDGADQKSYENYRIGGKLATVIQGAKNVVAWKKKLKSITPHIIFQFLVVRQNENQLDQIHQLAKDIGVDEVAIKTAQIYDYENGSDLLPTIDKYSRYRKRSNGKWELKNDLEDKCWKMWHSSVMTWDGKIVPCCFDKDASHQLGSVKNQSFKEIWNGTDYNQFRNSLFKSRKSIDICKNCTEGTKVWS